jgi:hypothetical protein
MATFDAFIDVWAILAGVLAAPQYAVDDIRRAASVLLHGTRTGDIVGNGYRSTESLARDLRALGASCTEGATIVEELGGWESLRPRIWGARKRVMESAGLQSWVLPKAPFSLEVRDSTVVQVVKWAFGRGGLVEVVDGSFAGSTLSDWPPEHLLAADSDEFVAQGATLKVVLRDGHRMHLEVGPGCQEPTDNMRCLSKASGCSERCPLYGGPVCERYQIGIGHPVGHVSFDGRSIRQQPAWKQRLPGCRAGDVGHQRKLEPVVSA